MKYFMILLVSFSAIAEAGDSFTVTRGGKTTTYSSEEYVVVKRRKPSPALATTKKEVSTPAEPAEASKDSKNMVSLYGGAGPSRYGMEMISPSMLRVSQRYEPVFGLGYSRKLNRRWFLHGVGLTNGTGLLGGGYSF